MSAQLQPDWRLRAMYSAHLAQVAALEGRAYDHPWSERIFADCLRAGYSAWVWVDQDDTVVAHAVMTLAVGEAHLLNLCVDPAWRRLGLARGMLEHLIAVARAADSTLMLLEVRVSNLAAQKLYNAYGFREIGRRKAYYPAREGREDAIVLARDFPERSGA